MSRMEFRPIRMLGLSAELLFYKHFKSLILEKKNCSFFVRTPTICCLSWSAVHSGTSSALVLLTPAFHAFIWILNAPLTSVNAVEAESVRGPWCCNGANSMSRPVRMYGPFRTWNPTAVDRRGHQWGVLEDQSQKSLAGFSVIKVAFKQLFDQWNRYLEKPDCGYCSISNSTSVSFSNTLAILHETHQARPYSQHWQSWLNWRGGLDEFPWTMKSNVIGDSSTLYTRIRC